MEEVEIGRMARVGVGGAQEGVGGGGLRSGNF